MMHIVIRSCAKTLLMMSDSDSFSKVNTYTTKYLLVFGVPM